MMLWYWSRQQLNLYVHKKLPIFELAESLQNSPLGSGSHSPFPEQVAELGPISSNPGGQLNLIVLPSTGILSS